MNYYGTPFNLLELAQLATRCEGELNGMITRPLRIGGWTLYGVLNYAVKSLGLSDMSDEEFDSACDNFTRLAETSFGNAPNCKMSLLEQIEQRRKARRNLDCLAQIASEAHIETYLGEQFNPLKPDARKIHLEDIAHALSNLCRFGGHTGWFYSVAQHSVLVSQCVPPSLALEGLFHDASEAYLLDLPLPIKNLDFMRQYLAAEHCLMDAISKEFSLVNLYAPEVVKADALVLATEFRDVMSSRPFRQDPSQPELMPCLPTKIVPLDPIEAEQLFLDTFDSLMETREADLARKGKE